MHLSLEFAFRCIMCNRHAVVKPCNLYRNAGKHSTRLENIAHYVSAQETKNHSLSDSDSILANFYKGRIEIINWLSSTFQTSAFNRTVSGLVFIVVMTTKIAMPLIPIQTYSTSLLTSLPKSLLIVTGTAKVHWTFGLSLTGGKHRRCLMEVLSLLKTFCVFL